MLRKTIDKSKLNSKKGFKQLTKEHKSRKKKKQIGKTENEVNGRHKPFSISDYWYYDNKDYKI